MIELRHRNKHNDCRLEDRFPRPDEERLHVEGAALLNRLVQGREAFDLLLGHILVEHEREDGQAGVISRVTQEEVPVVDGNRHKEVEAGEDSLDERDDHTTVHHKLTEHCAALVRQTTMPDDQLPDVLELGDREVSSEGSLHAFLADDT